MAGTTLNPSSTSGWNIQKWQRTVEFATYQKMVFIPIIDEGDRLLGQLNVRKHARVGASVLGQSADGTQLTYSNIIGSAVAVTPGANYVAVAWSENEDAQLDLNLDAEARGNIEQALAEATEQSVLANVQTLTQIMSQGQIDAPMIRQGYARLMGNTNGLATPGAAPTVYGIFSQRQYPALATIPEFNRADWRGDSENPYVKGIAMLAGGARINLSTVVAQDANGDHNCLFLPSAFVISWNIRSRLKSQDYELTNRLIVYNNLGSAVKNDLRAIALRTTQSAA